MSIPYGPILVVEDNPNVLELLEVTLRFKGYPVITARNGLEALEIIAQQRPALLISDILMPRMDGYSLAHALRKEPKTAQLPILFISATYVTNEDKRFALSLGASHFMEKPIDTEDFLLTVAEILTSDGKQAMVAMDEQQFFRGYRERLESKINHKNTQIGRTQRLLHSLPVEQRPAFETLLANAITDRNEVQDELDELLKILEDFNK